MDLLSLSQPDAALVQHGLKALGFYDGTTRGIPASQTLAAYDRYLKSVETVGNPVVSSSLARELVRILSNEEGVREIPSNSNKGKRVEEYQAATWLNGTGWAWCAAFICWGIRELEKKNDLPFKRPETAGAWDFERWAKEEGLKLFKPKGEIKAGDILVYSFSHIGLAVEDEKGGQVKTVEGNTSASGSREGGGVYIQTRKTSLVRSHIRLFP